MRSHSTLMEARDEILPVEPGEDGVLDARVLAIDDDRTTLLMIRTILRSAGFTSVEVARDGVEGLKAARRIHPDIIILDIWMPRMDGYQVAREIRNDAAISDVPILVQTAADDPSSRANAFEAGATDLVAKPVEPRELIARLHIHLENRLLLRRLRAYHERTAQDLADAYDVQHACLPPKDLLAGIHRATGIRTRSYYEASAMLGGDLWGVKLIDETRFGFFVSDFSGHGVTAALNTFRLHTLVYETNADWTSPSETMGRVNAELCQVLKTGQFATILCGVIDTQAETIEYAAAGWPPPIWWSTNGGKPARICESGGIPLGIARDADYPTHTLPFNMNSAFMLYSDALIEQPSVHDRLLTPEHMRQCLSVSESRGPFDAYDALIDPVLRALPRPLADDVTVVCFAKTST